MSWGEGGSGLKCAFCGGICDICGVLEMSGDGAAENAGVVREMRSGRGGAGRQTPRRNFSPCAYPARRLGQRSAQCLGWCLGGMVFAFDSASKARQQHLP